MMKMTGGQLICCLILIRVFTLMTYLPTAYAEFSGAEIIISILISSLIQIVLALPILTFLKKEGDIFSYSKTKNAVSGNVLAVAYAIIFVLLAVNALTGFKTFLTSVGGSNSGLWGMLILLPICLYGLVGGISALGKFSGIIMGVFILTIASIGIFSLGNFDILNFVPFISRGSNILNAVIYDLSVSFELIPFIFLIGRMEVNPKKCFLKFLTLKTIILEVITIIITGILGGYAQITEYPFFKLGSYTGIHAIERMDALYLVFWTLNAILTVTVFLSASAELLGVAFKKLKYRNLTVIVTAGLISLISSVGKTSAGMGNITAVLIVAAFFAIPLILLIWRKPNEN